jgi:hypothetical protein
VYVTEDIVTSTVWYYDSKPYVIQADIAVADGCTLTIEPGVDVRFDGPWWLQTGSTGAAIIAVGELDVGGTTDDMEIHFTRSLGASAGRDGMGVRLVSSDTSVFEFCVFYALEFGLFFDTSDASVFGSRFNNCGTGVYCADSSPNISNCSFFSCPIAVGAWGRASTPTLRNCNFTQNHLWNIYLQGYDPPLVTIDARECYWQTQVTSEIEDSIYHDVDNPAIYGHVDFSDWNATPAVEQTSWGRIKSLFLGD